MLQKNQTPLKSPTRRERWRARAPLLAILALVSASLACINSELSLVVKHEEGQVDSLEVVSQRNIKESWINAAKEVNQERAADFAAAGRSTDTDDILPITPADFGELFNAQEYIDQGYDITTS
ncbi:MAG: hypothetical protein MUO54_17115, partial [Anaerolineales bacterium]|nr:hypothetical protein [Anaerolineales bacterium]